MININCKKNNISFSFQQNEKLNIGFGRCIFYLDKSQLGDETDSNYIELILSGLKNLVDKPALAPRLFIKSYKELFIYFENILIDDQSSDEEYNLARTYLICNWGSFLDNYSIYSFMVTSSQQVIVWKKNIESIEQLNIVFFEKADMEFIIEDIEKQLRLPD